MSLLFIVYLFSLSSQQMLRIDSKPSLSQQLDTIFLQLDERLQTRDLRDNCRQLRTQTHHVMEIARNYDFRDVEANGECGRDSSKS